MDNNENIKVETNTNETKHPISTIALVCGIVSLVGILTSFIPFISLLTAPFIYPAGVAGIILGIIGIKKEGHKNAKIGLILSIVGLILNIIVTILSFGLGLIIGFIPVILEGMNY
ncbi:MAG: hypothetical protein E7621_00280 [Ruminococcaceae bacterium]|nr:hypothetical protein [Oscillospiraceae bacterium]